MIGMILLAGAAVSADGPDLAAIDRAVAKCDAKVMTATFSEEPQRRRAFAIAAFSEQQEIVAARRTLAARRLVQAPATPPALTPLPVSTPVGAAAPTDERAELEPSMEHQARLLGERQQELDDARMLSNMRDQVLDLMRQQYLSKCAVGKAP